MSRPQVWASGNDHGQAPQIFGRDRKRLRPCSFRAAVDHCHAESINTQRFRSFITTVVRLGPTRVFRGLRPRSTILVSGLSNRTKFFRTVADANEIRTSHVEKIGR